MGILAEILHDRDYRRMALVAVVCALIAIDMAIGAFAGWTFYLVPAGIVLIVVVRGVLRLRAEKRGRLVDEELPHFEERRLRELRHRLAEDELFHTHCHECDHFSPHWRRCELELHGRRMWVKLDLSPASPSFCLYWNVCAPAHLLRDERPQSGRL